MSIYPHTLYKQRITTDKCAEGRMFMEKVDISFRDDETYLLREVERRSKLITKSGWVKQAIAEKIERDDNREIKILDDFIKGK